MLFHGFEKVEGPDEVVFVVSEGIEDGLGCGLLGCEVKDGCDGTLEGGFLLKDPIQEGQIEDVALIEVEPFFVGVDVSVFGEIMGNRFENSGKAFYGAVEVIVNDG
jgi:hypothetical protein